jgi:hypothetical protein
MTEQIRIIPHNPEGIPDTGSLEVVWPGGKRYIYWDDLPAGGPSPSISAARKRSNRPRPWRETGVL